MIWALLFVLNFKCSELLPMLQALGESLDKEAALAAAISAATSVEDAGAATKAIRYNPCNFLYVA